MPQRTIEPYRDPRLPERFLRWIESGIRARFKTIPCYSESDGSPEGVITGTKADRYFDLTGNQIYVKTTSTGNTGWVLVDTGGGAPDDLQTTYGASVTGVIVLSQAIGGFIIQDNPTPLTVPATLFAVNDDLGNPLMDVVTASGNVNLGRQVVRGGVPSEVRIWDDGVQIGHSDTPALGGLFINNLATGAGLERVLTTADLAVAVPASTVEFATLRADAAGGWLEETLIKNDRTNNTNGGQLVITGPNATSIGNESIIIDVGSSGATILSAYDDYPAQTTGIAITAEFALSDANHTLQFHMIGPSSANQPGLELEQDGFVHLLNRAITFNAGYMEMTELTAVAGGAAGKGRFWVRDDVPNVAMFTDDAGTAFVLNGAGGALPASTGLGRSLIGDGSGGWIEDADVVHITSSGNSGFAMVPTSGFNSQITAGADTLTLEGGIGAPFPEMEYLAQRHTFKTSAGTAIFQIDTFTNQTRAFGLMRLDRIILGGGVLDCQEGAGTGFTALAGRGYFWVRSDVPNTPMFTDDSNVDHVLNTDPGVVTFEGRSGAVLAIQADYDAFFLTPAEGNAAYGSIGDVAANTAKVTNATHTGQVTGATALALGVTAITAQPAAGALVGTDTFIVNDGGVLSEISATQMQAFFSTGVSIAFNDVTSKTGGTGNYQTTGDFIADNFEATGLGPLVTPGTEDLYVGGFGIMGDRAGAPVYVTNANATGQVQINAGGVHGSADRVALFSPGAQRLDGVLFLEEQTAAQGDTAAFGQIWVDDRVENMGMFTNDVGQDFGIHALSAYKPSDQIVNNSTTLVSDTALVLSNLPAGLYRLSMMLLFRDVAVSNCDARMQLLTSGVSSTGNAMRVSNKNFSSAGAPSFDEIGLLTDLFDNLNLVNGSGTSRFMCYGTFRAFANASITVRWAQNVATVQDLEMESGSYIALEHLGTV